MRIFSRRFTILLIGVLLVILGSIPPQPTFARSGPSQAAPSVTLQARAGFDGYCKPGFWIPVHAILENQGPTIEGRLEVHLPAGGRQTNYAEAVSLPSPSRKELFLYVFPDGYFSSVSLRLVSGSQVLVQQELPVNCTSDADMLTGVVSSTPSAFGSLRDIDLVNGKSLVAQLSLEDLPPLSSAWGSLDALVLSGVDTTRLTLEQQMALEQWVASGGQLLVTGGPGWQANVSGLADLLPVAVSGTTTLEDLTPLSDYAQNTSPGASTDGPVSFLPPSGGAVVASGNLVQGARLLVASGEVPLLAVRALGHGKVFFLSADPALDPIRNWPGSTALYQRLLAGQTELPVWGPGFTNWDAAASAISDLPGLILPAGGLIFGFLLVYIFAVGPLNFFLVRLLKRRELAWVTTPLLVLVFSALAFALGSRNRGAIPVLNRMAVVQVFPGVEQARVDGLVGIFSPRRATYRLEVEPGFLAHPIPNRQDFSAQDWVFQENPNGVSQVSGLRLDVAGLAALTFQGQVPTVPMKSNLTLAIAGNGATLQGQVENTSGLLLKDAVLLAPGDIQRLGDLAPGETRSLQIYLQPSNRATAAATAPSMVFRVPGAYGNPQSASLRDDLLGQIDYSRDRETYQRYLLVNALGDFGSISTGRGGQAYLAGWVDSSPLPVTLSNERIASHTSTLYFFSLPAALELPEGQVQLPPGLFTWQVLFADPSTSPGPYDTYLSGGSFGLGFRPVQAVSFKQVASLTLHLSSYGATGPANLQVSLFDFGRNGWSTLPNLAWGDVQIPEPDRFVSSEGEIRLRLGNSTLNTYASIERADFTLVVSR